MTSDLVFLPATAPTQTAAGEIPRQIPGYSHLRCHAIRFPEMVWYNAAVRARCVDQLRALPATRPVLVGFSKSGLGAWNLARELGDALAATVIFDAPMARLQTPPWDAARFYPDDAAWQRDLPALHVPQMTGRFAPGPLIMVTGCKFHDEMVQVSRRMAQAKIDHCLLPQPQREHHWQSGWLQDALAGLAAMGVLAASADPA